MARPGMGRGLATMTISKKGFHEEKIVLDRARDGQQKVTLTALPPDPPKAVEAPPKPAEDPKDKRRKRPKKEPGKSKRPKK